MKIKFECDRKKFVVNPITGELDLISKFNANRIVTNDKNLLDRDNLIYDAVANTHLLMGPLVVTDNDGNVILADEVAYLEEDT